jgi:hypothetical protein
LLLAEKWLRREEGAVSLYIDITAETDLSNFNSGALLAGFGRHLYQQVAARLRDRSDEQNKIIEEAGKSIGEFCYGKTEHKWIPYDENEPDFPPDPDDFDDPPPSYYTTTQIPGKLKPPLPALKRDLQSVRESLEILLRLIRTLKLDVVAIFDGWDRLLSPEMFFSVALRRLSRA